MAKKTKIPEIEKLREESKALYDAVNEEPDLPCVLISTSYIDQCLASLLKQSFTEGDTANRLLDSRGILGTFMARADLCYCLKIITKELYNNLRKIAEIRNIFAHNYLSTSFDDPKVKKLCEEITFPVVAAATYFNGETGKSYDNKNPFTKFNDPRSRFTINAVLIANRLLLAGLSLKKTNRI